MTAADPRDGLPELPECFTSVHIAGGNHAVYSNGQMHEMYRRGKADALAHARPEAVDSKALEVLFDALSDEHGGEHHEDGCDVCRAIATLTPERAP